MCRNIRPLFNFSPPASAEEISAAALQYVRKISGYQKPSERNREAFERAVEQIGLASKELIESLATSSAPKDREVERERAKQRSQRRFVDEV